MAKDEGQKWGAWWQRRRGVELEPRLGFLWNRCHPAGRSDAAPSRNPRSRTCGGGSRNSNPFQESLELGRPGNLGSSRRQQVDVPHALLCARQRWPREVAGVWELFTKDWGRCGNRARFSPPFPPRSPLEEGQGQKRAGPGFKRGEAL